MFSVTSHGPTRQCFMYYKIFQYKQLISRKSLIITYASSKALYKLLPPCHITNVRPIYSTLHTHKRQTDVTRQRNGCRYRNV